MTPVRFASRAMLASMFVTGGVDALRRPEHRAELAKPVLDLLARKFPDLPQDPVLLVRVNAAVQVVAGMLLATGRLRRASALVLAASLVPTTIAGHRFWEAEDPDRRRQQMIHFQKNVAMLGGLLLAAVDTEGKPSVSWRVRRVAHETREKLPIG